MIRLFHQLAYHGKKRMFPVGGKVDPVAVGILMDKPQVKQIPQFPVYDRG